MSPSAFRCLHLLAWSCLSIELVFLVWIVICRWTHSQNRTLAQLKMTIYSSNSDVGKVLTLKITKFSRFPIIIVFGPTQKLVENNDWIGVSLRKMCSFLRDDIVSPSFPWYICIQNTSIYHIPILLSCPCFLWFPINHAYPSRTYERKIWKNNLKNVHSQKYQDILFIFQ